MSPCFQPEGAKLKTECKMPFDLACILKSLCNPNSSRNPPAYLGKVPGGSQHESAKPHLLTAFLLLLQ